MESNFAVFKKKPQCSKKKPVAEKSMHKEKDVPNKILIYERRVGTENVLVDAFNSSGFEATSVSDISQILDIKYDLLVTEIEDCSEVTKRLTEINPEIKIIIFSNFSRDKYIEDIYINEGIRTVLQKSYKIKDLIKMSQIAINTDPLHIFTLDTFMDDEDEERIIRSLEFKINREKIETHNIGYTVFNEIENFFNENNIKNKIEDIDMLHYAIGELIDNSIEAQLALNKKDIEINFKYGFDEEKFGFSIHDKLGTLSHNNVVTGIGMKIYDENGGSPPEHYYDNTYIGPRGRGYYIIQYSVHRLSVAILKPETAKKYKILPCTEANLLVYFNKKRMEIDNQIGPCGISMVITI